MSRFSRDDFLLRSEAGLNWYLREDENGDTHIGAEQDVTPILDANVASQNASDGWSHDKTFRHIGRIPLIVIEQWKNEAGINFHDENAAREVIRRLNSNEFYKLRTSNWKV
jgi:hypothetical protein